MKSSVPRSLSDPKYRFDPSLCGSISRPTVQPLATTQKGRLPDLGGTDWLLRPCCPIKDLHVDSRSITKNCVTGAPRGLSGAFLEMNRTLGKSRSWEGRIHYEKNVNLTRVILAAKVICKCPTTLSSGRKTLKALRGSVVRPRGTK